MKWYVKLFAPLIAGILAVLLFIFSSDLGIRELYSDDVGAFILGLVMVWAAIQSLFFPKRNYKHKNRLGLLAGVLIYFIFFVLIAYGNSYMGRSFSATVFFVISIAMAVAYFFRHRRGDDSLAPEWMRIKTLAVLGAFGGFSVVWLYLMDESTLRIINFEKRFSEEVAFAFLLVWGVCILAGISLYYIEAILHRNRSSSRVGRISWNKLVKRISKAVITYELVYQIICAINNMFCALFGDPGCRIDRYTESAF